VACGITVALVGLILYAPYFSYLYVIAFCQFFDFL
jgi:hypothetical protein